MFKIFYFLRSKLHNCKVIIDAGSHKGQMINLFKFIYSKSKIFGFEPQKKLFLDLLKKYSNNKNIQINNFALGNSNKKKKLILIFLQTHQLS